MLDVEDGDCEGEALGTEVTVLVGKISIVGKDVGLDDGFLVGVGVGWLV